MGWSLPYDNKKERIFMKKLAVLFPGIGYTCARPLLYYTGSMAAQTGYEVLRLDYGSDIHSFKGRTPEEMKPITKLALSRTLEKLQGIPWKEYDSLLFIAKSIGTMVSCKVEEILEISPRPFQFLITPIPDTIPLLGDIWGLFFSGTADPYISSDLVREAAKRWPEKTGGIFEGCNHSLEKPGDTLLGLQNLIQVCTVLQNIL